MRENVVYVGRGEPSKSPGQWLKDKLAARYTEKGRINLEITKIEKVMGPLTDEQRAEAAERLHLEGKVKKQVTVTIIKDAVIGTAIVGGTAFLASRPDVRTGITSTVGAGTRVAGEYVSEKLQAQVNKLRPAGGPKPTFFKGLAASILTGTDHLVTGVTTRVDRVLLKATQASVNSMEGRVINADVRAQWLAQGLGADATDKAKQSAESALRKLAKLENRQAVSEGIAVTSNLSNLDTVRQAVGDLKSKVQEGTDMLVQGHRMGRADEVAKRLQKKIQKAIKVTKP